MANVSPDLYRALKPGIQTPFTDRVSLPGSNQHSNCAGFESQYYRCMEAFGTRLGRLHCDLEHRDLIECVHMYKQQKRADAIAKQRAKLYREGKLDEKMMEDWPPPGTFKPDYFSKNKIL